MVTSTKTFGKLGKPELSGGLVVMAGTFDFGASATLSAKLSLPLKTVIYASFQNCSGNVVGKAMPPFVKIGTFSAVTITSALIVNRLSAGARYSRYVVIGY